MNARILIADDEVEITELIKDVMKELFLFPKIEVVHDWKKVRYLADTNEEYDIVICDKNMPFKELARFPKTKLKVVCTGDADVIKSTPLRTKVDAIFEKPNLMNLIIVKELYLQKVTGRSVA